MQGFRLVGFLREGRRDSEWKNRSQSFARYIFMVRKSNAITKDKRQKSLKYNKRIFSAVFWITLVRMFSETNIVKHFYNVRPTIYIKENIQKVLDLERKLLIKVTVLLTEYANRVKSFTLCHK